MSTTSLKNNNTNPWWIGVPTKLVQKTTLVPGTATVEAFNSDSILTLPVYTLTFEIPCDEYAFTGKAKRHDRLRIDLGDIVKMVIPGYKPKSYSMSALRLQGGDESKDENCTGEFDVTFKVYPNGRASGYLDSLRVGDEISSFGLHKNKIRHKPLDSSSIVGLVAYGVGITEAWPIAKAELDDYNNNESKVVLLWSSRTTKDTFWNDEISEYQQKYPNKFVLVQIFSREKVHGCLYGRINLDVLRKVFKEDNEADDGSRFLSVGTKPMMAMTDRMLEEIGFPIPKHALLV
eukprot:CAMPEP_0194177662 /NCGR_PEP_ID=MMETSP0154-20130528/11380_1 /TAXON_ID=1049557 /ORGANISM="Thalassiothrix antarctica, Strain L6-D1" /LENGTH=289 /DNA_ID=CAMNT_0038892307 /DNA_START=107 /DNA_END=973 /DNA_ORIENTATION=+